MTDIYVDVGEDVSRKGRPALGQVAAKITNQNDFSVVLNVCWVSQWSSNQIDYWDPDTFDQNGYVRKLSAAGVSDGGMRLQLFNVRGNPAHDYRSGTYELKWVGPDWAIGAGHESIYDVQPTASPRTTRACHACCRWAARRG